MVIHPLALPGTFLATRCAGRREERVVCGGVGGGGFSSPVTFCNFHSNYITLAAWGRAAEQRQRQDPSRCSLRCPHITLRDAITIQRRVLGEVGR